MMTTTMMMIIIIGRIACRISKIRPIVIDGVVWSVCQSVCRSVDLSDRTVSLQMQNRLNRSKCHSGCGLRWAQIGATLRTRLNRVHERRRCGLMSNYFDHLLVVATLAQQ